MNRTKVLLIIPHLKAGGAERVVSSIFKHLDRTVFEPYLIVIGFEKENHYLIEGIGVIYLNKQRLRSALFEIIKVIRLIPMNPAPPVTKTLEFLNIIIY